jgi:hypothetical protein
MHTTTRISSRETFIRFVVGCDTDDADCLDGLFVMARCLRDEEQLESYEREWLEELYAWFNAELPCPPFLKEQFPTDAVCWFRESAGQFVSRMWDLAALLREHACPVRMLRTTRPGTILYQDPFQVVAVPGFFVSRGRGMGYCTTTVITARQA